MDPKLKAYRLLSLAQVMNVTRSELDERIDAIENAIADVADVAASDSQIDELISEAIKAVDDIRSALEKFRDLSSKIDKVSGA